MTSSVSVGVREMTCRLNNDSSSFRRTAENLDRTAQIEISAEQVRLVVEEEGRRVQAAQDAGTITPAFQARDCVVDPQAKTPVSRVYLGVDGVTVPVVTEAEKIKRREAVIARRRASDRDFPPLSRRRRGSDRSFKEFKVVAFPGTGPAMTNLMGGQIDTMCDQTTNTNRHKNRMQRAGMLAQNFHTDSTLTCNDKGVFKSMDVHATCFARYFFSSNKGLIIVIANKYDLSP